MQFAFDCFLTTLMTIIIQSENPKFLSGPGLWTQLPQQPNIMGIFFEEQ